MNNKDLNLVLPEQYKNKVVCKGEACIDLSKKETEIPLPINYLSGIFLFSNNSSEKPLLSEIVCGKDGWGYIVVKNKNIRNEYCLYKYTVVKE